MLKEMKDINMSKDVKYIEIHTRKLDNKRMKAVTVVDYVDICWNKVCTSQSRRRRLVCLVLGSAGAGRGQAMGQTGICSACHATDQDRRRRGWRRQHLAQPRSRTGRALRTAVRWPGYRPRHPSHHGPRARSAHATTTRTGIRGEQLGGQTDPGSGDSP